MPDRNSASRSAESMVVFDRYSPFTDVDALKKISAVPLRKSLRVNTLKSSVEQFVAWANERKWKLEPVPWCSEGFFIDRDDRSEALGKDLLHLLGHTYMQEAASMLPVALLDPQPGETILDMSAAPGSKTTQMAARMNNTGVVVANDVQEKRLWTLKAALHRCGVTNAIVTKKVGQWFARNMTERFDRVLCDAPCTAQGTARKDSDALMYSSLENVGKMARLQRELLESAIDATKVGGRIVYSTCTLTPEENEEVIASMLKKFEGKVEVVDMREQPSVMSGQWSGYEKAISDSGDVQTLLATQKTDHWPLSTDRYPMLRLWPQTYDTEGFFCAVLRKTATTRTPERRDSVQFQEDELPKARKEEIAAVMEARYGTSFLEQGDRLFARVDQLLLANDAVAAFRLPTQDYALGIPFGKRLDANRVRMGTETITLRGHRATRNLHRLSDEDLRTLLDGHDITCPPDLRGDVILLYRDVAVGWGLAQEGKLKNRLPRWVVQKS